MILGIDPGLDGALACYEGTLDLFPMPTLKIGRSRREIDTLALDGLLREDFIQPELVVIEDVGTHPSWSASSSFTFGKSYGMLLALLVSRRWPMLRVKPQVWKSSVLVGTDHSKEAAIAHVKRLFPDVSLIPPDKLKESHDFAEAACLALYGAQHVANHRNRGSKRKR